MVVDSRIIEDFQKGLASFNFAQTKEMNDTQLQKDAQIHTFVWCSELLRVLLDDILGRNFSDVGTTPETIVGLTAKLCLRGVLTHVDKKWMDKLYGVVTLFAFDRLVVPEGELKDQYEIGERLLPFFYEKMNEFVDEVASTCEVIDGTPW